MKAYKSTVQFGNVQKLVVAVNWKGEDQKETEQTVDRLHHIHVLDRSYSMSSHLNGLIENVKQTVDLMSDNDLISVVWFSGQGEGAILLKGASKSDDVKKLLDTLKRPVGLTCFSEPLANVNTIIDDLSAICSAFSVTFFTDGETVTHHSSDEEEKRIFEQIGKMKNRIMALNTIGYGHWYNKELLQKMADESMFGKLIHSSQIGDYSEIWSHTYKILADMVVEKVKVEVPSDTNAEILYLSSNDTKLSLGSMELGFLNKTKNQFFIILDKDTTIKFNDKELDTASIKPVVARPTRVNFLWAYAYETYYAGHSEMALDVLMTPELRIKEYIDGLLNAFTSDERQAYQKMLRSAIFKKGKRFGQLVDESYVPADDAFCVMDLLKVLADGNNFYVPVKDYNRIGLKVEDNFNLFESNNEPIKAPFNEFVFNAQHLNLSIRYMVNGKVKINPKQAKAVGLPTEVASRIFRNQTIVKDGNLNINRFETWLDKETLSKVQGVARANRLPELFKVKQVEDKYNETRTLGETSYLTEINLSSLPIINRQYSKKADAISDVRKVVEDIEILKADQKVFKFYLGKQTIFNPAEHRFEENNFNPEQIDVLKQHGLNSKLDYQGVANQAADKVEEDYYLSRLLEFKLKGWSSLPKVDDVRAKMKDGKKLNDPGLAMAAAVREVEDKGWDIPGDKSKKELDEKLKEVKKSLFDLMVELNTLKIAKVLTGSWWTGLEIDGKGNYTFENLIVKNDRVKKFF